MNSCTDRPAAIRNTANVVTFAVGVMVCLGAAPAMSAVLNPAVAASIRDSPIDGLGDIVDPFDPGLLRLVPNDLNVENRAIAEFDLSGISPALLTVADLGFTLSYNNDIDPTDRQFNVSIYSGNGAIDVSDFEVPVTILGQFHLFTLDFSPVTYSGESILSLVQAVLLGGADFVGVRFEPVGALNPPSIVSDITLTIATVPEPSSLVLAAVGLIGFTAWGWRRSR